LNVNSKATAPDILYQVADSRCSELYPAAVTATPILLDIALQSQDHKAATETLAALDTLIWFRAVPPFESIDQQDA
jgi:hypothetical protein